MDVKISDYGTVNEQKFIEYDVSGLSASQMDFLDDNLDEETKIEGNLLKITMYFEEWLYPFQSDAAKFRLEDFISCEEIEMNVFLSSFLEDM